MTTTAIKADDPDTMSAWFAGKAPRRLLAIPFTAPIPSADGKGRDLDGEYFDRTTDIKPDWFDARPVLWHHGIDPTGRMASTLVGKADNLGSRDGRPGPDDDGWWVDLWLMAGERHAARIKALVDRGAKLYGSSSAIPHLVRRGADGHIRTWPYIEQTLSTAPKNTDSTFAIKAVLEDFNEARITVPDVLRDVLTELDTLRDLSPDLPSGGEGAAKAEDEAWMEALASVASRADAIRASLTT